MSIWLFLLGNPVTTKPPSPGGIIEVPVQAYFTPLLAHRCTVRRKVYPQPTDRIGQPSAMITEVRYTDIPCRLDPESGSKPFDMTRASVSSSSVGLYVSPAFAISEDDEIATVFDRAGNLLAKDLGVSHVKRIAGMDGVLHHYEVKCDIIRTSTAVTPGGVPERRLL